MTVVDSDAADGAVEQNGAIRIRFNRYLLPSSITRQSVVLVDSSNQAYSNPIVTYDPVTLTVTLSNSDATKPNWLTPGQVYKVLLPLPAETTSHATLLAIDGAGLDPATTRTILFTASATLDATPALSLNFCTDIYPVFQQKCGAGTVCHSDPAGAANPASSLVLLSPEGVANTALNRVAQGANTGGRAGIGAAPGKVFGVDMPLIAPGNPGNSWLLYKTLLAPVPVSNDAGTTSSSLRCRTKTDVLANPVIITSPANVASDAERTSLADAVLGREMPYPPAPGPLSYATSPLTYEERERLSLWIGQGAVVEACGTCE